MDINFYNHDTERLDEINENLSIIQGKNGLTFGTDSYLLGAFCKSNKNYVCCELGGGTGVISLLLCSKEKCKRIYCVEIQEYYSELIKRNAVLNKMEDRIHPVNMDIRNITRDTFGHEMNMVVTNPPYMKVDSGFRSKTSEMDDARRENNGNIEDFIKCSSEILKFGGYFYVVYRPERTADLLYFMRKYSIEPKRMVFMHSTYNSKPSLIFAEGIKGGSPGLVISKPLVVYKKDSKEYTFEMNEIYNTFSMNHLFT